MNNSSSNGGTLSPSSLLLQMAPYVNLVEHCAIVLCQFLSALFMGTLLLFYIGCRWLFRVKQLSHSMLLYMFHVLITATLPMAYHIYVISRWRPIPVEGDYNPDVLLWTGLWQLNFSISTTMAVFFLTADRCLILMLSNLKLCRQLRISLFIASIVLVFGAHIYNSFSYFSEMPFAKNSVCQGFVCLLQKSRALPQIQFKLICGLLVVFSGCLFIGYLHTHKTQLKNIKNRTVKFTVLLELILNIGPNVVTYIFTMIAGFSPSLYFGEYVVFFFSIDMLINSCYYFFTFLLLPNQHNQHNHQHQQQQNQHLLFILKHFQLPAGGGGSSSVHPMQN